MDFDTGCRRRWRLKGLLKDREAAQTGWPPRDFADNQDTYRDVLVSMFEGRPADAEEDLQKLLTPNFYMRSAEGTFDFAQFVAYTRRMRAQKTRLAITTVMFLRDGNKLAAHLVSTARGRSGSEDRRETFHFAEVSGDGRLACVVEAVETCASPEWDTHVRKLMRGSA